VSGKEDTSSFTRAEREVRFYLNIEKEKIDSEEDWAEKVS